MDSDNEAPPVSRKQLSEIIASAFPPPDRGYDPDEEIQRCLDLLNSSMSPSHKPVPILGPDEKYLGVAYYESSIDKYVWRKL